MKKNFCFSILALKPKYRLLAKQFAQDLQIYSPNTNIVIGTDNPSEFNDCQNVSAFKMSKKGILHCYHDKRFVIKEALTKFKIVIQIDADTRIIDHLPHFFDKSNALATIHSENLIDHLSRYNPERLPCFYKLAHKLSVDLNCVNFIGESLFAVCGDSPQVTEFMKQWDLIANYLQLHGIHSGEGNAIGLAAYKANLDIIEPSWLESIDQIRKHIDASTTNVTDNFWTELNQKVDYHYRLNQARIFALQNFDFYYR